MEFKMERQNLVEVGQKVEVVERSCPANYHYIIKPAVAMSGCVAVGDRLSVLEGVVKDIKHNGVKLQDHLATILFLWCQELHFKLSHMNRQIDIFLRAVPWCLHQIFAQGSILNLWSQHLLGGKKTDHVRHDPAFHAHMQSPFRKVLLLCNILVNIAGYCNFLFCCVQIINEISFVSHSQPFVLQ